MAPRSIGVLMSIITSSDDEGKVIKAFTENMDEVFTHPQVDITNHLVHLSDNTANGLRCHLYSNLIKRASSEYKEDLLSLGIAAEDFSTLGSRLCKRYKITAVYDDIYMIGLSLIEKSLHKDFKKLLTQAPKKPAPVKPSINSSGAAATAAAANGSANKAPESVSTDPPQIHSTEKALIDALTEIKSIVTAIRQENKDLKSKIDLLTTKVDKQNKEILSLKSSSNNRIAVPPTNSWPPPPQQQPARSPRDGQQQQQPRQVEPVIQQQLQQQHQQQPQQQQAQERHTARRNLPGDTAGHISSSSSTPSEVSRQNPLLSFGSVIQPAQCPAGQRRDCVNKATCFFRHLGEKVGDPVPKGEWTLVTKRQRKPPLFGSKSGNGTTIAGQGTVREMGIFIGGINDQLTVEDFSQHIKDNLGVTPSHKCCPEQME